MKWGGFLILFLAAAIQPGRAQLDLTDEQADAVTIALVALAGALLLTLMIGAVLVCCVCARCCEVFQCVEACWPFNYAGPIYDSPDYDYGRRDYYTEDSGSTYRRRKSPPSKRPNRRPRSHSPATTVGSRPWEGRNNPYVYDEGYKPRKAAPPPKTKAKRSRSYSPRPRYQTSATGTTTTYRTRTPRVQVVDEFGKRRARSIERIIVYGNGAPPMAPPAVPQAYGYAAAPGPAVISSGAPLGYGPPAPIQGSGQVTMAQLQQEPWFGQVQQLVNSGQI